MITMHTTQIFSARLKKTPIKQICLFICALSLAACASEDGRASGAASVSAGLHYDPAAVSKVKSGVTTVADLERWFGQPFERKALPEGKMKLVWQYIKRGRGVEKNWLFVTAGADGKVESFGQSWYYGNR